MAIVAAPFFRAAARRAAARNIPFLPFVADAAGALRNLFGRISSPVFSLFERTGKLIPEKRLTENTAPDKNFLSDITNTDLNKHTFLLTLPASL